MATIQTVQHLPIKTVAIQIKRGDQSYRVTLTANGELWTGVGSSVIEAVEDTVKAVRTEKRAREKGRNSNRYRIARTLL